MITPGDFLRLLAKSRLLADDDWPRVHELAKGPDGADAQHLADRLVELSLLTRWQANQLLKGRSTLVLGRYRLLDRLGEGGMGIVFKALHSMTGRVVALKVMSKQSLASPDAVARFEREVKAAATVNHPNLVTAFDSERAGQTHFLVMEYVPGRDLNQWIKESGPLPIDWSCECIRQAALGLQHAHERGLVHRDIKPSNLLIVTGERGRPPIVKILDMGLARLAREAASHEPGGLTQTGQILGTPDYIAPEQARDTRNADIRSDIFSLGCTLFRMLTGELPWTGANVMQKLVARARRDAPPVSSIRSEVPPELDAIVARMLARDPGERYPAPIDLARALARFSMGAQAVAVSHQAPPPTEPAIGPPDADAGSSIEAFLNQLAGESFDSQIDLQTYSISVRPGDEVEGQTRPSDDLHQGSEQAGLSEQNGGQPKRGLRNAIRGRRLLVVSGAVTLALVAVVAWSVSWLNRPATLILSWPTDTRKHDVLVAQTQSGRFDGSYHGFARSELGRKEALAGGSDKAAFFDGVDNVVLVADQKQFDFGLSMTLEFWMNKSSEVRDWVRLVGKGIGLGGTFGVWEEPGYGRRIRFLQTAADGSAAVDLWSTIPVESENWYHVAVTVDRRSATLYIDGFANGSLAPLGLPVVDNEPLTIGQGTSYGAFHGFLDEVAVYDRALPAATIREHSRAGRDSKANYVRQVLSSRPVGYWRLDEEAPARAQLLVDGTPRVFGDLDPLELVLPAGRHQLEIRRYGFQTVRYVHTFDAGERRVFAPKWRPLDPNDPVEGHWLAAIKERQRRSRVNQQSSKRADELAALTSRVTARGAKTDDNRLAGDLASFRRRWPAVPENPVAAELAARLSNPLDPLAVRTGESGLAEPAPVVALLGEATAPHWGPVECLAVNADGTRIATAGADQTVCVWDAETRRILVRLAGAKSTVRSLAFSTDGRLLAATGGITGQTGEITLWEVESGNLVHAWVGHANVAYAATFIPNEQKLITGGSAPAVHIWDVTASEPISLASISVESADVSCLSCSPDGQTLAVGLLSGPITVWDVAGVPQQRTALAGHAGGTMCVAFSNDGRRLASGGADATARIWDMSQAEPPEMAEMAGHGGAVRCVVFSPDGKTLATAERAARPAVRLWEVETSRQQGAWLGHAYDVSSVAFAGPDMLVSGGADHMVRFWDLSMHPDGESQPSAGGLLAVCFSPDGRTLATAGMDGKIRLWDPTSGRAPKDLTIDDGWVRSLDFSADGRWLASAGDDGQVRLWDQRAARPPITLAKGDVRWTAVRFNHDSTLLAAAGDEEFARFWDTSGREPRGSNLGQVAAGGSTGLAFSPDGERFAAVGRAEPRLIEWGRQRNGFTPLPSLAHPTTVTAVDYSPDGESVATADAVGTVHFWNLVRQRERLPQYIQHRSPVNSLAYSPSGRWVATAAAEGTICLWEHRSGRVWQQWRLGPAGGMISRVSFSPDGRYLATANGDGTCSILRLAGPTTDEPQRPGRTRLAAADDLPSGPLDQLAPEAIPKSLAPQPAAGSVVAAVGDLRLSHGDDISTLCFNHDGQELLTSSIDATAAVWNTSTGQPAVTLKSIQHLYAAAFSPDGKLIVTGGHDGTVRVWDRSSGRELFVVGWHAGSVRSVAFSPDGNRLASGGDDMFVKVWDMATGTQVHTLEGHTLLVSSVAFDSGGRWLASASHDKTIRIWDAETGAHLATLSGDAPPLYAVAFSPGNGLLVVAAGDGAFRFWNLKWNLNHAPALEPQSEELGGFVGACRCLSFNSDGTLLAVGDNATVRLFEMPSRRLQRLFAFRGSLVQSVAISPDGTTLAAGGLGSMVQTWDLKTGRERLASGGLLGRTTAAAMTVAGNALLTGSERGVLRFWPTKGESLGVGAPIEKAAHQGSVHTIVTSPDGTLAASAGADGAVRVWDADTFEPRHLLLGHMAGVAALTFSPDGATLASGDVLGEIRLWDTPSGELRIIPGSHLSGVTWLAFTPDGRELVSIGTDGRMALWDAFTGKPRRIVDLKFAVVCAALTPDGKSVGVGAADTTVHLLDRANGRTRWSIGPLGTPSTALSINPEGNMLAAGFARGIVRLYDARRGLLWQEFQLGPAHGQIRSLAFHSDGRHLLAVGASGVSIVLRLAQPGTLANPPDKSSAATDAPMTPAQPNPLDGMPIISGNPDAGVGIEAGPVVAAFGDGRLRHWADGIGGAVFAADGRTLISAGADGVLAYWDLTDGRLRSMMPGPAGIGDLAISPDGQRLALGRGNGIAEVRDAQSGAGPLDLGGHTGPVTHVAFSRNGRMIVSTSADNSARLWESQTGRLLHLLEGHTNVVAALAFDPDKKTLVTGGADGLIKFWNTASGRETRTFGPLVGAVNALAYNPAGDTLAAAGDDGTLKLLNRATGDVLATLTGHNGVVSAVAFSEDGQHLATGSGDATIILWDAGTLKPVHRLRGHAGRISGLRFSKDGRTLASWGSDPVVRLWDTMSGEPRTLAGTSGSYALAVKLSRDAASVVTGAVDGALRTWQLESGDERVVDRAHDGAVLDLAFTRDGKWLASCGVDQRIKVWNWPALEQRIELVGHSAAVASVAFSPDGRTLVSGAHDGLVKVWDLPLGAHKKTLKFHEGAVEEVAFNPDGTRLATGGADQRVVVWDTSTWKKQLDLAAGVPVTCLDYGLDGKLLAASGLNGWSIWQTASERTELIWQTASNGCRSLVFTPDGQMITANANEDTVEIWDVKAGLRRQVFRFWSPIARIHDIDLTGNGRYLATANPNGTAYVIRVAPDAKRDSVQPPAERESQLAELSAQVEALANATPDDSRVSKLASEIDEFRLSAGSPGEATSAAVLQAGLPSALDLLPLLINPLRADNAEQVPPLAPEVALLGTPSTQSQGPAAARFAWTAWGSIMRPNRATQELETWNPAGERSTIKLPGGGFDLARATFDPSRRMLAAAAENGSVHLWECQTGARKTALGGHRGSVETFAFSPDGRAFASTSPMDGLKIWDIDNGLERFTLRRGIEGTSALAFSADSALVAQAGTLDYRIDVWDAKTASHWGRLTGHAATVAALAFAPQGRQVASASSDGTVRVWDLAACRRVNEELAAAQSELADLQQAARKKMGQAKPPRGAAKQPVPLARWQFDGDYRDEIGKLHGTAFGNARIENGRLMLDGLDSYVTTAPIAQPLAAKSLEAWVALDDLDQRGGAALALQTLDAAEFDAIVFGELEPRRWMAGSMSYVRTQSFAAPLEDTLSGELVHVVITYTRDGIVTCYRDGKRYGTPYRTTVLRFDAGQAGISFGLRHMPSVPDRLLAGEIEQAALYNRALTANEVAALAKSGLGTRDRIRSGLSPRQFRRYDELTAKIMRLREEPLDSLALVGHAGAVLDVAYSPDGARLASVGADGTLRLWDSGSGSSLATYLIDPAHSAPLRVAFSPEGRHVGVIDSLGQVHVVRP